MERLGPQCLARFIRGVAPWCAGRGRARFLRQLRPSGGPVLRSAADWQVFSVAGSASRRTSGPETGQYWRRPARLQRSSGHAPTDATRPPYVCRISTTAGRQCRATGLDHKRTRILPSEFELSVTGANCHRVLHFMPPQPSVGHFPLGHFPALTIFLPTYIIFLAVEAKI